MRKQKTITASFDKLVPGGQALGVLESGKKIFGWGVLPNEAAKLQITKSKSHYVEAVSLEVIDSSDQRIEPKDSDSYLSTSPWQIMKFDYEQKQKVEIIKEAYAQNKLRLNYFDGIYSDNNIYNYRNKVEFSFWWEKSAEHNDEGKLNLAFFRRGSQNKVIVEGTSLAKTEINDSAKKILKVLRAKQIGSRYLKTLLLRSSEQGEVLAQLYVKDRQAIKFSAEEYSIMGVKCFEVIYSEPKSPASVITDRLQTFGQNKLTDKVLDIDFDYSAESFFQVNIPVYEVALRDISKHIDQTIPVVDLYSGVGTIGLSVSENDLTMVELNKVAVDEMKRNIKRLNRQLSTRAVLSSSEKALNYITSNTNLIVDPPRAGLDIIVRKKILDSLPQRVIYLSCNPITQARDVADLNVKYDIMYSRAYNFFPRTPHIENLVVLERKQ